MSKVRALSGAADQVFSSLSNGLILYAVAVVTTAQYFGQLALLFTLVAAAIGCLRGALGTPLLLRAGQSRTDIRREGSYGLTTAVAVSLIVGLGIWALDGAKFSAPTALIMIATPIVLVQDVLRYVAICEGRPHVAAFWDGIWCAGSIALLVATWLGAPSATLVNLMGGWACLAFVALVGMALSVRVVPRVRGFAEWVRTGWQHRIRYATESGLEQVAAFAILVGIAALLNPTVTAAVRGSIALLAPVAIFASAIPLMIIPESARLSKQPQQVWGALSRIAVVSSLAAILIGFVLGVLPDRIGYLLLGSTFESAQAILPVIALEYAIGSWVVAVTTYLRTFNRSADALWLKVAYVTIVLATSLTSALVFKSAMGVAVGIAVATTFVATVALVWFEPWAVRPRGDVSLARPPVAAKVDALATAGIASKPEPFASLAGRTLPYRFKFSLHPAAPTNSALISVWTFATMVIFVPALIIRYTAIPTNFVWVWSIPVVVLAGARFAWIMGSGERRLFETMFWGFTYMFMGLAPLTQLREGVWSPTVPRIDSTLVIPAAIIVIAGVGSFLIGAGLDSILSRTSKRADTDTAEAGRVKSQFFTINQFRLILLCLGAIAFNFYYLSHVGWIQFLKSRDDSFQAYDVVWRPGTLGIMVRAASYMSLLVAWIALVRFRREANRAARLGMPRSRSAMHLNLVLIVVVGLLLANSMNPISNARYLSGTAILAAGTALGVFATTTRFRISSYSFFAGLLLVFPLADAFRNAHTAEFKSSSPIQSLLSADYDSFGQVVNGYLVATREGIVFGRQFSGVIMFWLPRNIWVDKPVDTGIYIANVRGYPFTNLSAPLWIELYLNGGLIVVILGMFALGFALHRADTKLNREFELLSMPRVLGCILPFYMMILLRGSLLQAASYLFFILIFTIFITELPRSPRRNSVHTNAPPDLESLRNDAALRNAYAHT